MLAGVALTEWFKYETSRIYELLSEPTESRQLRQLAEWIAQHGGRVRTRDIVSGRRDIANADDADRMLQELVNGGFGSW